MNNSEFENIITKIVGLQLSDIHLVCEMMVFNFEQYSLHSQCLTRIIKNNDILVTTLDYQSWDGEVSENNDERFNLAKYKSEIDGGKVINVKLSPLKDLTITLDNDITIEIFIQNSYSHYDAAHEQYRFFEVGEDNETAEQENLRPHYVVYSKHIDLE